MHKWPSCVRGTARVVLALMFYMLAVPPASALAQTANGSAVVLRAGPTGVEQFMGDQAANASDGLIAQATPQSPCEDPQFLELKKKPVGSMNPQEFAYFQQKDKDCSEYQRALLAKSPTTQVAQVTPVVTPQKQGLPAGVIVALAIGGTIVLLLIIGALASSGSNY